MLLVLLSPRSFSERFWAGARPVHPIPGYRELSAKFSGATVVRSLSLKIAVTALKSKGGWSLIASEGKPLGYVATRDLAPIQ